MNVLWDPKTNLVHTEDCAHAAAVEMTPCTLSSSLRRGHQPCTCCWAFFRQSQIEKNRRTIQKARFRYVYTPASSVYHRPDCSYILRAKNITGKQNYEKLLLTGRRPCKRCKPGAPAQSTPTAKPSTAKPQKDYPFWAEKGYHTFHLAGCRSLRGLTQLQGFSTYRNAVRSGLRPCRHCRPTAKNDPTTAIPICGSPKAGETVAEIFQRCDKAGFSCKQLESYLRIRTPVGLWKIDLKSMPIGLEHINLVCDSGNRAEYHQQPRLFLSLLDAFRYIRKHDAKLRTQCKKRPFYGR